MDDLGVTTDELVILDDLGYLDEEYGDDDADEDDLAFAKQCQREKDDFLHYGI